MSMTTRFLIILIISALFANASAFESRDTIRLEGEWYYRLHGVPESIPGEGYMTLPGTLDTNHIGVPQPVSDNTSRLTRKQLFSGNVSYFKTITIPPTWQGKELTLELERTRPSVLKIDGETVGVNHKLSSPHRYDISPYLSPGKHEIEIIINNSDSIPAPVRRNSNASSENTQTAWNGILGNIFIEAKPKRNISAVIPVSNPEGYGIDLTVEIKNPQNGMKLMAQAEGGLPQKFNVSESDTTIKIFYPIIDPSISWSEWSPMTFDLSLTLIDNAGHPIDKLITSTGFRHFKRGKDGLTINGDPVFLRGTTDSAVFPLTGHPPMTIDEWTEYFRTIKEYGLNHIRFHTWCPPEAAFIAADKEGVYLLIELPLWGELDRDMTKTVGYLEDELNGILKEYSHHPSFVMLTAGNELWGDISLMNELISKCKEINPGLLFSPSTNLYNGMKGYVPDSDFIISARYPKNEEEMILLRNSFSFADSPDGGPVNSQLPASNSKYSDIVSLSPVPIIAYEVGQYQMYPDYDEIDKYSGVTRADNLKEFKHRAQDAGIIDKAANFKRDSGKWAAKLYKAEIEKYLRTKSMGGFQLMGLMDYPGQGTATIGILDSFMDSKGIISAQEWRESCAPLTILAEWSKYIFDSNEFIKLPVKTVNFTNVSDSISSITWHTSFGDGLLDFQPGKGLTNAGIIRMKTPNIDHPEKFTLTLKGDDGLTQNSYDFWVFPKTDLKGNKTIITSDLKEALENLRAGRNVLLLPDSALIANASIPPLFSTDFWNYRMYRTLSDHMEIEPSPGTLGLSINNGHPSLKYFPTESHTDYQWFSIIRSSRPIIIDRLPKDFSPIIEVIDNVERNFRLALLLECNVGKGKLMILSADKDKLLESAEGKWLIKSLSEYLGSKECKPEFTLTEEQIVNLLTKPSMTRYIRELKNEIYDSNWE